MIIILFYFVNAPKWYWNTVSLKLFFKKKDILAQVNSRISLLYKKCICNQKIQSIH